MTRSRSALPFHVVLREWRSGTLAELEAGGKWNFLLRARVPGKARVPHRLRTDQFEVRLRYHLGDAALALPQQRGTLGHACDPTRTGLGVGQHALKPNVRANRYIASAWAALLVTALACAAEPGSFEVRFSFRDEPPVPERELYASAYVERGEGIRVARSRPIRFRPNARVRLDDVPNGDGYTLIAELKASKDADAVAEYYGRSEPFALRAGAHTSVEVALSLRPVPQVEDAAVRIVGAAEYPGRGSYVARRSVTLALSARDATEVSVADNPNFADAQTRKLSELERDSELYLWHDWDLDRGACAEATCEDGAREVFVRFRNEESYESDTHSVRVELDTKPPSLSNSRVSTRTASDGDLISLLVIAGEPLREAPLITVEPAHFQFVPVTAASDPSPGGLSFTYEYTVDRRAADGQRYGFVADMADLAGNAAPVELRDAVAIESNLNALSATLERTPAFAPFAIAPYFSRSDPVTGEPVRVTVRVTSNLTYATDLPPTLTGRDESGHTLELQFEPEQSHEKLAVFQHDFASVDPAGSYVLQLEWTDAAGRKARAELDPRLELRDAPKPEDTGAVDTGVDGAGQPRTLLTTRPWGHMSRSGYRKASASLQGWIDQRSHRPEHCIAQVLVHSGTSSADARPESLLEVVPVEGVTATGCAADRATFSVRFPGQPGASLFVTPVTVAGHVGRPQPVVHGEWVATLPPGVVGGAEQPHALHLLPRKPTYLYAPGTSVEVPASADSLEDLIWEEARTTSGRVPDLSWGSLSVYDPNHGKLISVVSDSSTVDVWQVEGEEWTTLPRASSAPLAGSASAYDSARDRLLVVGANYWKESEEQPGSQELSAGNQTWEWDGTRWRQLNPLHAAPDGIRAMAYDASRRRAIASTGCDSSTWLWDGVDWHEGPRFEVANYCTQAFVYDQHEEAILAFGNDGESTRTFTLHEGGWVEHDSDHRPPFGGWPIGAAYDSESRRTVVYREIYVGWPSPNVFDAWCWDGDDWSQCMEGEFAKLGQLLVYDEARRSLELFGGSSAATTRSRLDAAGWVTLSAPSMPPARTLHSMAYDTKRSTLVVTGGSGPNVPFFETWERRGNAWVMREVDLSPDSHNLSAASPLVFDEARGVALSVNPVSAESDEDPWLSIGMEVLLYDGTTVTRLPPETAMAGRDDHACAYDAARERVVLFGGRTTDEAVDQADTWEWDGAQWSARATTITPPARAEHSMSFDRSRGRTVLFGGSQGRATSLADTWEWDGVAWIERSPASSPPARRRAALAYDEVRRRVVLFGGMRASGGGLDDTWEWDGTTWTQLFPLESPAPRAGHAMAFDSARGRVVMYGGDDGSLNQSGTHFADAWEWDGARWIERSVRDNLAAANVGDMAYDVRRDRMVMIGGRELRLDESLSLDETWEWDGARWRQQTPSTVPGPRDGARIAYDENRQTIMVVGGRDGDSTLQDTWEWDGANWTGLATTVESAAGAYVALVHDRERAKTLLVGTQGAWEWTDSAWSKIATSTLEAEWFESTAFDAAHNELVVEGNDELWAWSANEWRRLADSQADIMCLVYDEGRGQLLAVHYAAESSETTRVSALNDDSLNLLSTTETPLFSECEAGYDSRRKQSVVLVAESSASPQSTLPQTYLLSSVQPAQRVEIDLTPLVGPSRERSVQLDGFAFHALTGADAEVDREPHSGVALDLWNGLTFRNVLENEATSAAPESLCFESAQPGTLGALEANNRWHFLLRPVSENVGPQRPRLQTTAFEVRIRYHLGDAAPAIPRAAGRSCDAGGWAYRDW